MLTTQWIGLVITLAIAIFTGAISGIICRMCFASPAHDGKKIYFADDAHWHVASRKPLQSEDYDLDILDAKEKGVELGAV